MPSRVSVAALTVIITACSGGRQSPNPSDSAFAVVQQRGQTAMGVDQYTSQNVFEPLADGGRIVLQRKEADPAGERKS